MDNISSLYNVASDYIRQVATTGKTATQAEADVSGKTDTFDTIYNSAVKMISGTNEYIENAHQAEIDFALGNISSTHELSVIQQKANLSLQYTVAIRDKVLEAYREIMNMQI